MRTGNSPTGPGPPAGCSPTARTPSPGTTGPTPAVGTATPPPSCAETVAIADRTSAAGTTWRGLLRGPADLVVTLAPTLEDTEVLVTLDSLLAALPRAVVRLGEAHRALAGNDPRIAKAEEPIPTTARTHLTVRRGLYGDQRAWTELVAALDGEVGTREVADGRAALEDLRLLRRAARWDRPDLAPAGDRSRRRCGRGPTTSPSSPGWAGGTVGDDRPLLVVVGNCQAESYRLLLDAGDVRTQRIPALHELTPADVPPLLELLSRTDLLVSQPTVDDYRGLPVGTRQLHAVLPPGARTALVPSLRYAGLHPFHLLVHPPGLDRPDPPLVPYHDVRTVLAADDERQGRPAREPIGLTAEAVRAVAAASVAELARREALHDTVVVSDLFERPTADAMRTINHPGNAVLVPATARLREALGLEPAPPGVDRPLLASLWAPLLPEVVAAHGLDAPATHDWTIDGRTVTTEEVAATHREWYARRPEMLDAALARAAPLLALLDPGNSSGNWGNLRDARTST